MHPVTFRLYEAVKAATQNPAPGPTDVSQFLGLANSQTAKNWEARGPSNEGLVAAAEMGISIAWLKYGKGDMFNVEVASAALPSENQFEDALHLKDLRMVPVVGEVKGGDDGYLNELEYPVGFGDGLIHYPTSDPNAYALRVRGDSMHPRYRAGEYVVVEPGIEPQTGDDVIVSCTNGRKLLKQLNWTRDGEVQLLSINDSYGPLTISLSEIISIHLVAGRARRTSLKI